MRHSVILKSLFLFPQIQLVALCNSRAMGEHDRNSDIDLFIIARKGNLWTARFIVTALTSILGVRRRNTHGLKKGTPEYIKRTKDKFCLSFFITEEAMNLDPIRIENDVYLDKWIGTLSPLVNKNATYERFMRANGILIQREEGKEQRGGIFFEKSLSILSYLFSLLSLFESFIRKCWLPHTLRTYEKLGKPWGVVISDTMLKFHDKDTRKEYYDLSKTEKLTNHINN